MAPGHSKPPMTLARHPSGDCGVIPIQSLVGKLCREEYRGIKCIAIETYEPASCEPMRNLQIYRELHRAMQTTRGSRWRKPILARTRVILGLRAEPLPFADRLYHATWNILSLLKIHNYPHLIRTRSDVILEREYLELLAPSLTTVCVPIPTCEDRECRIREPSHPSILRRRNMVSKLRSLGYSVSEETYHL